MAEDQAAVATEPPASTSAMSDEELEDYLNRCTAALKDAVREYADG